MRPHAKASHRPRQAVPGASTMTANERTAEPDLPIRLAHPITLAGGPRSHLVKLMDAAILIGDPKPFPQAPPAWDRPDR